MKLSTVENKNNDRNEVVHKSANYHLIKNIV
jgi:hypothetical protein